MKISKMKFFEIENFRNFRSQKFSNFFQLSLTAPPNTRARVLQRGICVYYVYSDARDVGIQPRCQPTYSCRPIARQSSNVLRIQRAR